MTKYLISFPSDAMQLSDEEFEQARIDSHRVVAEAKAAGVWVFGGGINDTVEPVTVAVDGSITPGASLGPRLDGGWTVLELPDRAAAEEWAAKIAAGCHCPQELREFWYDPES